jgi:CTP synthase
VKKNCVYSAHNVEDIMFVPELLEKQGIVDNLLDKLQINYHATRSSKWDSLLSIIRDINENKDEVKITIVGKYTGLQDSYLSVIKALEHAAINNRRDLKISWVESHDLLEDDHQSWEEVRTADGILVPGGFGVRGVEGKIKAIEYARVNKIPFLGI